VGQARQHRPAQPARAAPDRSPARHRSRHVPRVQTSLALMSVTSLLGRVCMPSSPPLSTAIIERLLLPKADGRFADGDSAGIRPRTFPGRQVLPGRSTTHGRVLLPPRRLHGPQATTRRTSHRQARAEPRGAVLSSDDYGSRVERDGGGHPLCGAVFGA
jgi:hypothetical protein